MLSSSLAADWKRLNRLRRHDQQKSGQLEKLCLEYLHWFHRWTTNCKYPDWKNQNQNNCDSYVRRNQGSCQNIFRISSAICAFSVNSIRNTMNEWLLACPAENVSDHVGITTGNQVFSTIYAHICIFSGFMRSHDLRRCMWWNGTKRGVNWWA